MSPRSGLACPYSDFHSIPIPPEYQAFLTSPQGTASKTWTAPPFHCQIPLTVPQLYEFNAKHSPEHPAFVFAEGGDGVRTIPHRELYAAVLRAAHIVVQLLPPLAPSNEADTPVVGILAVTGTPVMCHSDSLTRPFLTSSPSSMQIPRLISP